ncbi:hypothetical protein GIB67_014687 [Kingdonia uniflora]|uniref:Uncharacterized protein n=1 Tax=Kingdonia uniflora TaxID=39325 RepID=A0A7J7L4R4_9MAGN|nr:hypothetical protein GIB67_014687 [Kingdonia uniflora]
MGSRVMRPSVRRVLGAVLPETFSSREAFGVSGGVKGRIGRILREVDAEMDESSSGDRRGSTLSTKMDQGLVHIQSSCIQGRLVYGLVGLRGIHVGFDVAFEYSTGARRLRVGYYKDFQNLLKQSRHCKSLNILISPSLVEV